MKTISYKQIMSFDPCYDPKEIGMPEDYEDTVVNFIQEYRKYNFIRDIIWILCRKEFMNERDLRLFTVWCAQQVKHIMKDQRSLDALIVAEKFAFGEVDLITLYAASDAAAYAAAYAASDAAAAYAAAYAVTYADSAYAVTYADSAYAASDAAAYAYAVNTKIDKLIEVFQKPNGEWFERRKE